jgi:hypothetical protein
MDTENNRQLAEVLGNLAIEMQSLQETTAVLRTIVAGAIDVVPGTSCAGISCVSGRHVTSEVPSDPIAAELDQLQTELYFPWPGRTFVAAANTHEYPRIYAEPPCKRAVVSSILTGDSTSIDGFALVEALLVSNAIANQPTVDTFWTQSRLPHRGRTRTNRRTHPASSRH